MKNKVFTMNLEFLDQLFPFGLVVDSVGEIKFVGRSMKKLLETDENVGSFDEHFVFKRPLVKSYLESQQHPQLEAMILQLKFKQIEMMGQRIHLDEGRYTLLTLNLVVHDIEQLGKLNLTFNDFALHDPVFDFMMLLQTQKRTIRHAETLNHKLAEAHQVAMKASETKSLFLANMSHELRTPMNGVIGIASVLAETSLDEEQRDYVMSIMSSGEAMLALINDILDLSKIEAGHIEIESEEFDLRDLIDEVFSSVAVQVEQKGLSISSEIQNTVPKIIETDRMKLRQVILNLTSNAIKFTDNGSVKIEVFHELEHPLLLTFRINDTGVGMTKDICAQLFQPFVQGDLSMSKKYGGTGLGLSICKRIIQALGGEIGVESTPEVGSSFWFKLNFNKINKIRAA